MTWHTGKTVRRLIGKGRAPLENAALELNTSSTTLYRWCLKDEWPEHLLDRMADYLGVNAEWLRTGKGDKLAGGMLQDGQLDKHLQHLYDRMQFDIGRIVKRYTREIVAAVKNPDSYVGAPNKPLSEVDE